MLRLLHRLCRLPALRYQLAMLLLHVLLLVKVPLLPLQLWVQQLVTASRTKVCDMRSRYLAASMRQPALLALLLWRPATRWSRQDQMTVDIMCINCTVLAADPCNSRITARLLHCTQHIKAMSTGLPCKVHSGSYHSCPPCRWHACGRAVPTFCPWRRCDAEHAAHCFAKSGT
jgi:hypothetical protein